MGARWTGRWTGDRSQSTLLQKEYELWVDAQQKVMDGHAKTSRRDIADTLAKTLAARQNLLKLLSMNHYDMEENCSEQALAQFKVAYGKALDAVRELLNKITPKITENEREDFIFSFFPFMFGIYPYVYAADKQKQAMKQAKVKFKFMSVYEITFADAQKLLGV